MPARHRGMEEGIMAGFNEILGHEEIKENLRKAIQNNRISHAYILSGERGMGKKTIARAFAMTLLCERSSVEPCMECHSCRQFLSDNHPDVIWVTHEKPATIGVDDIRTQINETIGIRPYESKFKIYLVDEAEKMTVQAQNALLKTIEEPPAYAILMLLTTNQELFLPTILSRCVKLKLKPLTDDTVIRYLTEKKGVPVEDAHIDAAFARGNLGKAVELSGSEEFPAFRAEMFHLLSQMHSMDTAEMLDWIAKLVKDCPDLNQVLDFLQLWYRDVLTFKVTRDLNTLIFRSEYGLISEFSQKSSYPGLEQVLEAIDKARIRLAANVTRELTLELMLLTMREN
jgi:DNA polymerase-3 subunit delta'